MLRIVACCLTLLTGCTYNHESPNTNLERNTSLIKNALIIDGSGEPSYKGDLRFDQNRIIAIGKLKALKTDQVIDAQGMVLAPGFIDSHSHHDLGLAESTAVTAAVSQGITTIVAGNDGSSKYPLKKFKQSIEAAPLAINIASYTGHGSIRAAVMGEDYKRKANDKEIAQMQALLADDLKHGSLGLATGLEYDPGIYSESDEVIAVAKTASVHGARYISHMRSEDRDFHQALEELIQVGREAKLPVQISHLKLAAIDIWGQAPQVLERLEQARTEGIDVTADIYPYTYWESTLMVLLPNRDFHDLDAARFALKHLAPADGLTLSIYTPNPKLAGKTVAEIATDWKLSNEETYLQLIRNAYANMSVDDIDITARKESVIGVSMSEDDIKDIIQWPHTNICSDGASTGHPRGHGAFPRALRKYVREQNIVSIEEMVRKMTSLSAQHTGIKQRGLLKQGYAADLVLFNPDTISDHATIEHPQRLSSGMIGVWVNGQRVWQDQQDTGKRPGTFVARGNLEQ